MILVAALLLATVGCSSTEKRLYEVTVKNETDHPITIWMTKDGPPEENGWRSPEQIAIRAPGHEERIAGMVVPAGKTAYRDPVQGEFERGSYAWLRVYDGKYSSFSELLSVSSKSVDRVDFALERGKNTLVVKEKAGRIVVEVETQQLKLPEAK